VWEVLSEDAIECRRKAITNGGDSGDIKYEGDTYRLYATGKAVTFAAVTILGGQPWLGDGLDIPCLGENASQDESYDQDSLVFLLSSLAACLDCCCDLYDAEQSVMPIMSSLWTCVAIFCSNACRSLKDNENSETFVLALEALGEMSLSLVSGTMKKSLSALLVTGTRGSATDTCLRSLLTALRGAALLAAQVQSRSLGNGMRVTASEALSKGEAASQSELDEDLCGGITDDAICAMTCDHDFSSALKESSRGALFKFLCETIIQSKVCHCRR
jgi:hypothetical protein